MFNDGYNNNNVSIPSMSSPITSACDYCGGSHTGWCWKIKRVEFGADGSPRAIEFFSQAELNPMLQGMPTVPPIIARVPGQ